MRSFSAFSSSLDQARPVRLRVLPQQFVESGLRLGQQPIAPALDFLEMPNLEIMALLALGQLGEHRLRVDIAHQFADILALPDLRSVRGQTAQITQCNEKIVRQVQRFDLLVGKGG